MQVDEYFFKAEDLILKAEAVSKARHDTFDTTSIHLYTFLLRYKI